MKYLLILLLFVGCSKSAGEMWLEEFDSLKITEQEAEGYIGKCYLHGSHRYTIIIERNTTNIHKSMRDSTVSFCAINKECDFRDIRKCVLSKNCGNTVKKEAIKYVLKKMNYYKEVECPK